MKVGYALVSTRDQNLDLQLDVHKRAGCERIYQDVASGSTTAWPALGQTTWPTQGWGRVDDLETQPYGEIPQKPGRIGGPLN